MSAKKSVKVADPFGPFSSKIYNGYPIFPVQTIDHNE